VDLKLLTALLNDLTGKPVMHLGRDGKGLVVTGRSRGIEKAWAIAGDLIAASGGLGRSIVY
jgi:hypothetical protein